MLCTDLQHAAQEHNGVRPKSSGGAAGNHFTRRIRTRLHLAVARGTNSWQRD